MTTAYTVCVNGEPWENTFEKIWSLQFGPDDRLTCIAMNDDEWTVVQEDEPWEETFEYVWNLSFSRDGSGVAANIEDFGRLRDHSERGAMGKQFIQMRSCEISPDGLKRQPGTSRLEPLSEGDIWQFSKGVWSLAVNGEVVGRKFPERLGLRLQRRWSEGRRGSATADPAFRPSLWTASHGGMHFRAVWEPVFVPGSHDVVAPGLTPEGWKLLINGKPLWNKSFAQVWHQTIQP